jgi:hypothetical protein
MGAIEMKAWRHYIGVVFGIWSLCSLLTLLKGTGGGDWSFWSSLNDYLWFLH